MPACVTEVNLIMHCVTKRTVDQSFNRDAKGCFESNLISDRCNDAAFVLALPTLFFFMYAVDS